MSIFGRGDARREAVVAFCRCCRKAITEREAECRSCREFFVWDGARSVRLAILVLTSLAVALSALSAWCAWSAAADARTTRLLIFSRGDIQDGDHDTNRDDQETGR